MNDRRRRLISVACAADRCGQCRGRVLVNLNAQRSRDRWAACTHHCHENKPGRKRD